MNRLDQLTELRSKLQADWLFKFTETDQSKPVTMPVTSSDLDGQACRAGPFTGTRPPVQAVVASGAASGVRGLMKGFLSLEASVVLVLAITQWDSLRSRSLLERRPPPQINGRGLAQWFEVALNPPEISSPEVISRKI